MKKGLIFLFLFLALFSNIFASYEKVELQEINGYNMAVRSAIYPGLGQLYLGEKAKGYLFLSIESLCIIGAVYFWHSAENKYNDYEDRGAKK